MIFHERDLHLRPPFLNDVDKEVVLADIIGWINAHLVVTAHIPEELPALAH